MRCRDYCVYSITDCSVRQGEMAISMKSANFLLISACDLQSHKRYAIMKTKVYVPVDKGG